MRQTREAIQSAEDHLDEAPWDEAAFEQRMQERIALNRELEASAPKTVSWTDEQVAALERFQNRPVINKSVAHDKFYGLDEQGNLVLLTPSPQGLRAGQDGPIRVTEIDVSMQKKIGMYVPPATPQKGDEIWPEGLVNYLNQLQQSGPHPFFATIEEGESPVKVTATTRGWIDPKTQELIPNNHDLVSPDTLSLYKKF